jgi:uncharacterized protein (TIGR00255 family)
MMAHSMTAFARSQQEVGGLVLGWELRSVNHRYLEIQFRIPEPLRSIEAALREVLRTHLKRGKLDCTLRADASGESASSALNRPALEQVAALIQQVRLEIPDLAAPTVIDVLRWPGVLSGGADLAGEAVAETATDLFEEALAELIGHRAREGAQLADGIGARLDDIDRLVSEVKHHTDSAPAQLQQRLRQRLDDLRTTVDAERLEQEVALLAQRADVAEELDRLAIHVEEMRTSLRGPGPHGRRLDFLTQELNREANTLGSKSVLAQVSQRAVDLKVVIEQIREQVQNLE